MGTIIHSLLKELQKQTDLKSSDGEEIKALELELGIVLPASLKFVFENISGNDGVEVDHVYFLGLAEFDHYNKSFSDSLGSELLLFSGFDDWCWGYAMHRSEEVDPQIYLIGHKDQPPHCVASGMKEFLEKCISNSSDLLGV